MGFAKKLKLAFPGLFTYSEVLDFGPRFWTSATPTTFPTSALESRKPVSRRRRQQYPSLCNFRSEPLFPRRTPIPGRAPITDSDIDDNIDSKKQEKWVENSATGTLAVTRDHPDGIRGEHPDIRIVMKFLRIRISGCHPRMPSGYRYPW